MKRLLINPFQKRNSGLIYPYGKGYNSDELDEIGELERISVLSSSQSWKEAENISGKFEAGRKEIIISDPSLDGLESLNSNSINSVEIPFLVSEEAYRFFGEDFNLSEIEKTLGNLKEKIEKVNLYCPLMKQNYEELDRTVKLAAKFSLDKVTFSFPSPNDLESYEDVAPNLTRMVKHLKRAVDNAILKDIEVEVRDLPLCLLVGYKRYLDRYQEKEEYVFSNEMVKKIEGVKASDKEKPGQCNICKYREDCPGIWSEYLSEVEEKEIMPITGKVVLTDNERCMVSILMEQEELSTKKILQLKSSSRFKDICAHCVGSDDVMVTGNNLREKDVVEKKMGESGYQWSLNESSTLVKSLRKNLEV